MTIFRRRETWKLILLTTTITIASGSSGKESQSSPKPLPAQIPARHADTTKRVGASQIKVVNGKCEAPYMYIPKVGESRFPAERQVIHNFELLNAYFDCKRGEQ